MVRARVVETRSTSCSTQFDSRHMNPYVKSVRALDDYQLKVSFENGERRIFDMKPYLSRGIFVRLRDRSLFHAARVVAGSVEWPTGVDLSYETPYTESRPSLERNHIAEETAEASKAIREGAFALVDCLGWKGIWKRSPESEIALIHKIEKIPNVVETWLEDWRSKEQNEFRAIETKILLISDTVAVSIRQKDSQPSDSLDQAYLIRAAAMSVIRSQKLFLTDEPPIAMRGCLSYGKHAVIGNFIVGEAVDETAEYNEIAEGALMWLLPSAVNLTNQGGQLLHDIGALFIPHDIPLKGGARLNSLVVNPLYLDYSAEERQGTISRYDESMSGVDRLDVWLKRQNTFEFLRAAEAASSAHEDRTRSATQ